MWVFFCICIWNTQVFVFCISYFRVFVLVFKYYSKFWPKSFIVSIYYSIAHTYIHVYMYTCIYYYRYVHHGTLLNCDEKSWDWSFNLNVKSMFHILHAFLPQVGVPTYTSTDHWMMHLCIIWHHDHLIVYTCAHVNLHL